MADTRVVETTQLFRTLTAAHPNVEVWADESFNEGGWEYFWIVSNTDGAVRNLAYVRSQAGRFQNRGYDANGDDMWVDAY
jgi:hypothetical protein